LNVANVNPDLGDSLINRSPGNFDNTDIFSLVSAFSRHGGRYYVTTIRVKGSNLLLRKEQWQNKVAKNQKK